MEMVKSGNCEMQETTTAERPLVLEREVPFERISYRAFKSESRHNLVFLTHSPKFTFVPSNKLVSVNLNYI